jgi:hypothetical protein
MCSGSRAATSVWRPNDGPAMAQLDGLGLQQEPLHWAECNLDLVVGRSSYESWILSRQKQTTHALEAFFRGLMSQPKEDLHRARKGALGNIVPHVTQARTLANRFQPPNFVPHTQDFISCHLLRNGVAMVAETNVSPSATVLVDLNGDSLLSHSL